MAIPKVTHKRQTKIGPLIMVTIMIVAMVGSLFFVGSPTQAITDDGLSFSVQTIDGFQLLETTIGSAKHRFISLPSASANMTVSFDPALFDTRSFNSSFIVSYNTIDQETETAVYASSRFIEDGFFIQEGTQLSNQKIPQLSCYNATGIHIFLGNESSITQTTINNNTCVLIQATSSYDLLVLIDAFRYAVLRQSKTQQ
jgi:hypothetical protein